jgi:hypothetical protein
MTIAALWATAQQLPPETRKELDRIWHRAEYLFQCAYVAALLNFHEVFDEEPIGSSRELERAIDFIESARQEDRYFFTHFYRTPFRKPTPASLDAWRLLQQESAIVWDARLHGRYRDEFSMLHAIGGSRLWYEVCNEVIEAVARSIRVLTPTIRLWASDQQIHSAVDRLKRERGFMDFEPDLEAIGRNVTLHK